jgi:hypothetical protein
MPKYTPKKVTVNKPIIEKKPDVVSVKVPVKDKEAEMPVVVSAPKIPEVKPIPPISVVNQPTVFPLNFIQVPFGTFGLDSANPIVHPAYKKLLDDTLINYKFHSFAISQGMFILAFELK